ncbi:MAG: sugar transferase [Parcubacteria group bacterium GW2011_GWE2_39_37]|nr:MAG: sugar transferase [Parcubacteria group bacterium GW2011_GWE2_39_37]
MKASNNIKKILLLLGDILLLYFSLYLALFIRYQELPSVDLWQSHFWPFTLIFIGWLLIFYITNLYDLRLAVNNSYFWQNSSRSWLISSLLSVTFFYLMPNVGIAPKTNLLIFVFIFAFLFFLWRQFYNWSLKSYLPKNNLLIIGLNEEAKELIQELKNKSHLGYNISFIISQNSKDGEFAGVKIINEYKNLEEVVKENKISAIIISADPNESAELREALFACLPFKISYFSLPIFYENITGKVPIKAINQMWFLDNLSEGNKATFDILKRFFDLILALFLLLITVIILPFISLIIKLDSRGPVFFTQTRLGKNGEPFTMIKFRTMREANNDRALTAENDSRVTRIGSFLRKTRIDELPQLINILKGEMSFIGPRPERPELVNELIKTIPFYQERMLVKPGVTGWDQVSGEYHSPTQQDTMKKLQHDLFYIKNRSYYLDFSIILKTVYTVFSKGGR